MTERASPTQRPLWIRDPLAIFATGAVPVSLTAGAFDVFDAGAHVVRRLRDGAIVDLDLEALMAHHGQAARRLAAGSGSASARGSYF